MAGVKASRRGKQPIGLWLFLLVAFAASAGFVGWRLVGPADGVPVAFYADAWTSTGIRVETIEAPTSDLRPGDVVVAIAGRSVDEWLGLAADATVARAWPTAGERITYAVERQGETVEVPVALVSRDLSRDLLDNWSNLLFAAVLLGVALYVLYRRPERSAAVALAIAATAAGASITPWLLGLRISDLYFGWPFLLHVLTVSAVYMLLWPAGGLHLPIALSLQAGGRAPSRRLLLAIYALPLGGYAALLLAARLASPTTTAWLGTWSTAQGLVIVPCIVASVCLAVWAYRRARPEAQRQLRWVLAGGAAAAGVGLALMFLPQLLTGETLVPWSVVGLIALPVPVGLAIAIARHRLFDIEVVVNRTLVYGGVTVAILAIYTATVVVLGALVPQGAGFAASLLATGLAAVAALPLRDVLQRTVNRLMYGDRDEPYRALARLAQRLESTIEPLAMPAAVVDSVAEALRLPYVALEIGAPGAAELSASRGEPVEEPLRLPLVYGAETVGQLIVAPRSANEAFSAGDLRLLEDLARSAGAAVHSVRLTLDIIRSRERLVAAREEERRRIRRDLHDGLGPTLAAIGMRAEVAADLAAESPSAAAADLRELTSEVGTALSEVRRLVEGLRPPALDELGLVGALRQQAERLGPEPQFEVSAVEPLPDLPAAVEVAAYRICVEAMTNAARHADARHCRVVLGVGAAASPSLSLEITDDGRGMPSQPRAGIGMVSMRERAAEVGGSLHVAPADQQGTRVFARLPLHRATAG